MRKVKMSVKECYKTLFELEDKIEFINYHISKQLDNEENLNKYELTKIEEQINDLEVLVNRRNDLRRKLKSFESMFIEIHI